MTPCLRGEIYYVAFDPAPGSEAKKTRPALVLQTIEPTAPARS